MIVMPEAPVNAVKTAQARTLTIAMPPGTQPMAARVSRTNRRGVPASAMM